jgi:hypothetical protein
MKKIVFLLNLIAVVTGVFGTVYAQIQIHVSPQGNDSNNGTEQSPFRTVERATIEAYRTKGDVTVFLHEATYRLSSPIVFVPQNMEDVDKSLTIRSCPGEKAVISGSIVLENLQWKPYKNGIMQTKISGTPVMDMLIVNGDIRHQARYPNWDAGAIRFNGTAADAIAPARVKKWKNPAGGYIHVMHAYDWGDFHYCITGKDKDGKVLNMRGGWQNNRQSGWHGSNLMVENIFEELDAPCEWFYDASKSTLYYYPPEGEDINTAIFESPQIRHLVEIRGSEDRPARNITFEGLDFTQTVRTFMEKYEPLLRSDWKIYRGAAIFFEGAENCSLKNCNIYNIGGNAVFFSNYNRNCEISGSYLTRIGASAVCFVGDPAAVRSPSFEYSKFVPVKDMDMAIGPKSNNCPARCRVHDNLIHKIGLYEKQITGIELSMSRAVTVSHNSIYDTPRAGINISEGTWGGHVLEFNDVFNTVKETGDHGSFNSWGRDRFWHPDRRIMDSIVAAYPELILADAVETTIIRNNRFRCDRGWDIDLDDGSTNYHICNNLCLNGGLKLREGFYRVVENNIFVNNTFHRHVWFSNNGAVFVRNIVTAPYEQTGGYDLRGAIIDNNIFADSLSYNTARMYGTDSNSVVARLEFIDPASGDFRVSARSTEIFRTGFQNFDMNSFGVVSNRLKAIAEKPEMPVIAFVARNVDSQTVTWESMKIKNLETLGERSATGMDSERGVYVISVGAYGNELRDYLKPNDVILGFAGKPVNSIDDLFNALAEADLKKSQQMIVFRNQKENVITIPAGTMSMNYEL